MTHPRPRASCASTAAMPACAPPRGELRVATDHLDADLAVGDWLVIDGDGGIAAVLERRTLLERRMPDDSSSSPVVAANVDIVVVANALDHPFSPRRLERFLLVAWESGAAPLVVLTKADAYPDLPAAVAEAEAAALGAPVLALSVRTGLGLDELRAAAGRLDRGPARTLGRGQEHARECPRRRTTSPRPPRCGATARAGTPRRIASCTCSRAAAC